MAEGRLGLSLAGAEFGDSPTTIPTRALERLIACLAVMASLSVITALSVRNGTFFDDEAYTLALLDLGSSPLRLIRLANSGDVHPPLGYIIFAAMRDLFGDWPAVKTALGVLNASALAMLLWFVSRTATRRLLWMSALLLGGTGTVVMWGTALRWYAPFNPVFWVLFGYVCWAARDLRSSGIAIAVGGLILFHINYLAVLAVPPLVAVALYRHVREATGRGLLAFAAWLGIAAAAAVPQAVVLATVHLHGPAQTGSWLQSLAHTAMTVTLGSAVFPVAIPPAVFAGSAAVAVAATLRLARREAVATMLIVLVLGVLLMVVSGLGARPRNSVYLSVPFALLLSEGLASLAAWLRHLLLAIVLVYEAVGATNVVAHRDTTKRSFDAPYPVLMEAAITGTSGCPRTYFVHHDPVVELLLRKRGFPTLTPWGPEGQAAELRPNPYRGPRTQTLRLAEGDCLARIATYRGAYPPVLIERLDSAFAAAPLALLLNQAVGRDRHAEAKSLLGEGEVPASYFELSIYRAKSDFDFVLALPYLWDEALHR